MAHSTIILVSRGYDGIPCPRADGFSEAWLGFDRNSCGTAK